MKTNQLPIISILMILNFPAFAQKATVNIFPEVKKQVIKSIGGNYCQANYSVNAADAIGNETLREFRP